MIYRSKHQGPYTGVYATCDLEINAEEESYPRRPELPAPDPERPAKTVVEARGAFGFVIEALGKL